MWPAVCLHHSVPSIIERKAPRQGLLHRSNRLRLCEQMLALRRHDSGMHTERNTSNLNVVLHSILPRLDVVKEHACCLF